MKSMKDMKKGEESPFFVQRETRHHDSACN